MTRAETTSGHTNQGTLQGHNGASGHELCLARPEREHTSAPFILFREPVAALSRSSAWKISQLSLLQAKATCIIHINYPMKTCNVHVYCCHGTFIWCQSTHTHHCDIPKQNWIVSGNGGAKSCDLLKGKSLPLCRYLGVHGGIEQRAHNQE